MYMESFRSLCTALEKAEGSAEGRKRFVVVCHFANEKLIIVERVYILKSGNDANVNGFLIPLPSAQVLHTGYRSYFFCETAARRQWSKSSIRVHSAAAADVFYFFFEKCRIVDR